ncbi:MAG: gliding motility-associated C-terminal domain-containing protein [Bacteroidota bacterium]
MDVDIPLETPVINCSSTTNSITFTWQNIAGANQYIVNGTPQTETTFTQTGLAQGESFNIQVIAVGTGACGNSSNDVTCVASNCPPVTIDFPAINDICRDANAGPITLTANINGGAGGGTGVWSGPGIIDPINGIFDPTSGTAQLGVNLITFDYTEGLCNYSNSISITINPQPSADFVVVSPICEGDVTTITYTGNALLSSDFAWDFDGGLIQSGTGAGPYEIVWPTGGDKNISLNVAQSNCGSDPFVETVSVETPLLPPNINCSSTTESITFSWAPVAGATTYLVNGVAQIGTDFTITGLTAGDQETIEVIAVGSGPCGNSMAVQTCEANACPTVVIDIPTISDYCVDPANPTATLVANITGSTGGTGLWTGPGIIDPINGVFDPNAASAQLGANLITFDYTDGNCSYSEQITITINDLPTVNAGVDQELSCSSPQLSLAGSGSGLPVWTGPGIVSGGTSFDPVVNLPGDYTVVVTDPATGCTSTDVVTITQDAALPIADAGSDETLDCNITTITLNAGGSIGFDFQPTWEGPGITDPNDPNPSISVGGTYILTILNTNNNCESAPDTVIVAEDLAEPIAGIILGGGLNTIDCNTSSISMNAEDPTHVGVTYAWEGPDGVSGSDASFVANAAGTYTVTITNPNGCTSVTDATILDDLTAPIALAGPDQTLDCTTAEVTLVGAGSSAGPNITYLWSGPGIVGAVSSLDASANVPGLYTLLVTNEDNGCTSTANVSVLADANAPIADAGNNQELDCEANDVVLNGSNSSGGNLFSWTDANGNSLSQGPTLTINETGIYYLEVTNSDNGCVAIDSVVVVPTQNIPAAILSTVVEPSCFGENNAVIAIDSVVGGTPPYVYSLDGNAFFDFNQFFNLTAGNYPLQVEDANGCRFETNVTINQPVQLTLDLIAEPVLSLGDTTQTIFADANIPNGAVDTLIWSPQLVDCVDDDCFEISLRTLINEASFSATLIDTFGCSVSDQIDIRFDKERLVYIPSAFAPDAQNSQNQVFMINAGQGVVQINTFRVFNRWGEVVFSAENFQPNDPEYAWDGMVRGKAMNPGVFVYLVEVAFSDNQVIQYSGDVTLLR